MILKMQKKKIRERLKRKKKEDFNVKNFTLVLNLSNGGEVKRWSRFKGGNGEIEILGRGGCDESGERKDGLGGGEHLRGRAEKGYMY